MGLPRGPPCAPLLDAAHPPGPSLESGLLARPFTWEVCTGPQDGVPFARSPLLCEWLAHQAVWVVVSGAHLRSTAWTQCTGALDAQGPSRRSALRPAPGHLACVGKTARAPGKIVFVASFETGPAFT